MSESLPLDWQWDEEGEGRYVNDHLASDREMRRIEEITLPSELADLVHFRRRTIYGARNLEPVLEAIRDKRSFAVVSGLRLFETMHLGTKSVVDQLRGYQERLGKKVEIFVAFSDIENWLLPRSGPRKSIQESIKHAMDSYLVDILALGLKRDNLQFHSEWSRHEVLCLATALARYVPTRVARKGVSFADAFFPLIVAADILHVQLGKYGGPRPTLVAVGRDQYPFLTNAWHIIDSYITNIRPDFFHPSFTYHGMLIGTDRQVMERGNGKHAIFLRDDETAIRKKMKRSAEGRITEKGIRKARSCPIYEILRFHVQEDPVIIRFFNECEGMARACRECKNEATEIVVEMVRRHQEAREQVENDDQVARYILEQDVLRETEAIVEITKYVMVQEGQ